MEDSRARARETLKKKHGADFWKRISVEGVKARQKKMKAQAEREAKQALKEEKK